MANGGSPGRRLPGKSSQIVVLGGTSGESVGTGVPPRELPDRRLRRSLQDMVGDVMLSCDLTRQQQKPAASVSFESDEELAWRTVQEVEAFRELYRRYRLPVYRYHLARSGHEQTAQNLTSRTFLAALEGITSLRFGGRLITWLFGLAGQIRREEFFGSENTLPPENPFDVPDGVSFSESGATSQLGLSEIAQALNTLADDTAEAVILRLFARLNTSEIGQVMLKSDAAVKMLVYRGLCDLIIPLSSMLETENDR